MIEYIDRKALLEKVKKIKGIFSTPLIIREIENAPTINIINDMQHKKCKENKINS